MKQYLPAADSPYWIHHHNEIEKIISGLCSEARQVVLQDVNKDNQFILTTIVEITKDFIILEADKTNSTNNAFTQSNHLIIETTLEHISLLFEVKQLTLINKNERAYLKILFPSKIHKLQRREFFRLPVSKVKPLICHIPHQQNTEFKILDISLGGLRILNNPNVTVEQGDIIENCFIILDNKEQINFNIEVRYKISTSKNEQIGLKFVLLKAQDEQRLNKYIMLKQREQHFGHN